MQDLKGITNKTQTFDQLEFAGAAIKSILPVYHSNIKSEEETECAERVVGVLISDDSEHTSSTMSNEQHFERQPESSRAPEPAPFNPVVPVQTLTNTPATCPSQKIPTFPNSVVSDLMRVYESMTQSSTPQDPSTQPSGTSHDTQYQNRGPPSQQQYHYHQQMAYPNSVQGQSQYNYIQPTPQHQGHYQQPGYPSGGGPLSVPALPEYPPPGETQPNPVPSTDHSRGSRSTRAKRPLDDGSTDEDKSKTRKKGADSDGRWSKRFTWPDDLHRDFVSAIFDVGLKHSSPSAILDHMPKHDVVTSERIKSHLQKYRLHRSKAKKEFMTCYEASIKKFHSGGLDSHTLLASGEVAAHASYATMSDAGESSITGDEPPSQPSPPTHVTSQPRQEENNTGALILPLLSEEEKRSPIGTSLGYLLGLFFSVRSQLMAERAAAAARAAEAAHPPHHPVGDVYTQFANDSMAGLNSGHDGGQQDPSMMWSSHPMGDGSHSHYPQESPLDQSTKACPSATSSTRTNLEENTLMKREMQNQMHFQNKMRALKQQELEKYNKSGVGGNSQPSSGNNKECNSADYAFLVPNPINQKQEEQIDEAAMRYQGAGEAAEGVDSLPSGKERGLSVGNSEEFWHTDVVDEQLFEFLMNP